MSVEHTDFIHRLMLECQKRIPEIRLRKATTGVYKTLHDDKVVHIGTVGQADIHGFLPCTISKIAVHVEIEVKVGRDQLSDDQKNFRAMCLRGGAVYIESRNIDETIDTLITFMNSH